MAKSRPSVQKRINESKKIEKAQAKAVRKAARGDLRIDRADAAEAIGGDIDPDLAGIVAGPQPVEEDPLAVDGS